jgi:hypothetical protein
VTQCFIRCLFSGSYFSDLIIARERFLGPSGSVVPSMVQVKLCGCEDGRSAMNTSSACGLDISEYEAYITRNGSLGLEATSSKQPNKLLTSTMVLVHLDLAICDELVGEGSFKLNGLELGNLSAFQFVVDFMVDDSECVHTLQTKMLTMTRNNAQEVDGSAPLEGSFALFREKSDYIFSLSWNHGTYHQAFKVFTL